MTNRHQPLFVTILLALAVASPGVLAGAGAPAHAGMGEHVICGFDKAVRAIAVDADGDFLEEDRELSWSARRCIGDADCADPLALLTDVSPARPIGSGQIYFAIEPSTPHALRRGAARACSPPEDPS